MNKQSSLSSASFRLLVVLAFVLAAAVITLYTILFSHSFYARCLTLAPDPPTSWHMVCLMIFPAKQSLFTLPFALLHHSLSMSSMCFKVSYPLSFPSSLWFAFLVSWLPLSPFHHCQVILLADIPHSGPAQAPLFSLLLIPVMTYMKYTVYFRFAATPPLHCSSPSSFPCSFLSSSPSSSPSPLLCVCALSLS